VASDLVYSSEFGRMCTGCGKPKAQCGCSKKKDGEPPKGDGRVRVGRQTKGRKGKGVTIITGLPLDSGELRDLAKDLKDERDLL